MNLHPCPLCGESKGYTLNWSGYMYQVCCNACGKVAANSYMEARADAAWNSAAAHAQGLRERIAELEASDALQPCGHPKSLVLHSAESGEPLYCETCDDKSGRRDAELRESELAAANAALRKRIAEFENEAREQALQALASEGQWIEQTGAQQKRIAELERDNANLKTVMVAAAEEIHAHWDAHCDAEGYGPQNLMRRLEEGIPSEYGYTAGAFAAQQKRIAELEHEAQFYKRRCDAMQEWQSRMRDPERTVVCDILANGFTLDPSTGRYAVLEAQRQWQPIETAPMDGQKVILFYLNRNNFRRTVMARWVTDEQAAETDADDVGLEAGWYECIDNWDDYCQVCIHEGEPTHWVPLPPPPIERAHGIEPNTTMED